MASAEPILPPGFQESVAITGLVQPMVVRFSPDGRVFVAEKSGLIKVFDDLDDPTPSTYADLRTQVYDYWDRGLLGMALAPNFPVDPSIYVLYTRDAMLGGAAPRWNDACPTPPGPNTDGCVASARLSRLNAAGNETVLVTDWCQQFPSHSVGQIQFGPDGALYASAGDGAAFHTTDYGQLGNPVNPCGDPVNEGGSLRAQDLRTAGDPVGLDGTVIRVSPATGAAFPGNPLSGNADLNARRIVVHGLRNPYRTTFRPGTSELWIGDVGFGKYDEIDRITDVLGTVENGGWPCIEGPLPPPAWERLRLPICENLYAAGPAAVHAPYYSYPHADKVVPGESCPSGSTSLSGLAFYQGGPYPAAYDGALFFADYSRDCIWAMRTGGGALPNPANVLTFVAPATNPVALEIGPGGDLYYVDFGGDPVVGGGKTPGTIRRISYFAGNQPPTARIVASTTSGLAPLTVQFDGRTSSDPESGVLSYSWDLDGDGQRDDSTSATPQRTYTQAGTVTVKLRVTDPAGLWDEVTVLISVGNTAPSATITAPTAATRWAVGQSLPFAGTATDGQDGTLPASAYSWELLMHHCPSNCHTHPVEVMTGATGGAFVAPDHEYPSHLELRLTVTDSGGLQDTATVLLQPRTVDLTLDASVPGIELTLGSASGPAPFTETVIEDSVHTLSAPATQTVGGVRYAFRSWSDGGARIHTVTASSATTFTATYARASGADLGLKSWARRGSGTVLSFFLRVRNNGPVAARSAVLTATLPSQVWFNRLTGASGCSFNPTTDFLRCPLGTIKAKKVRLLRVYTWLNSSPKAVVATARVRSATSDPNPANNRSRLRFVLR
ncbi:MAG TPA: PQQ-dependent sugar dehydrogenase [Gaiellaceae bacterium]|nr:PQQ-dependent sugar dehydrogenase [Gaiellaceae bacterium]